MVNVVSVVAEAANVVVNEDQTAARVEAATADAMAAATRQRPLQRRALKPAKHGKHASLGSLGKSAHRDPSAQRHTAKHAESVATTAAARAPSARAATRRRRRPYRPLPIRCPQPRARPRPSLKPTVRGAAGAAAVAVTAARAVATSPQHCRWTAEPLHRRMATPET